MTEKKVFISIPWFHPAFRAGGPVQSVANLVNEFKEDVCYYIFCGNTDLNNAALENIITDEWVIYNDKCKVMYAGKDKRSESILKQLSVIKPDILYIIGIFSWHFNIVPLFFSSVQKKIVSVRGMLHPGALSQKKIKKKLFLLSWKISGLHTKCAFHATDEKEKKYIEQIFPAVPVYVAGNFPRKFSVQAGDIKNSGSLSLISIALISPMKNILLILMALEKCSGNIDYHICGPVKDNDYWQLCKKQMEILPAHIHVHYHAEILPAQVEAFMHKAQVFILPSKSENFGHAIFEALSAGKPVITSMHTPWNGLEGSHAGLNVETEVESIKNAIDHFTGMDEHEYRFWSAAAVDYAGKAVNTESIKKQYTKMFFEN